MDVFKKKLWKNIDVWTLLLVTALFLIGVLFIINARATPFTGEETTFAEKWAKLDLSYAFLQALWFGIGLVLVAIVAFFDYHTLVQLVKIPYIILVVLLALLGTLAKERRGIQAWLTFGNRGFQPSEIFKIIVILLMAGFAARSVEKNERITLNKDFFITMLMIMVPTYFVFAQPDAGTALIYIFVVYTMLFAGKMRARSLILVTVVGLVAAGVFFYSFTKPYQKARFLTKFYTNDQGKLDETKLDDEQGQFLKRIFGMTDDQIRDSFKDYDGAQVATAVEAIKAGGMTGRGFFKPGSIVQLRFLKEAHTDFIFASSIEAVGAIGGMGVIALYLALLLRALYLASKAKDVLGSFIIFGVVSMEFAHIFENIGMNIDLLPVTGIPLPFISYGGSSMFTNMIGIGLIINVAMRRPTSRFSSSSTN